MSLTISRILHAGYIFECGESKIAFDPIFENPFSRNCFAFPNVTFDRQKIRELRLDAVFISHFHDDHCSFDSLDLIARETPIFLYCVHDELFEMVKELGFKRVYPLFIDESVTIGSFVIIPRRALDADVDSIFQIKAAGLNVLNVVDAWIDPLTLKQLASFAPWDMVLWPFQTMREIEVLTPSRALVPSPDLPAEWIEQLKILKPRFVVPSSCQFVHEEWSWYNRALFPISYHQFQIEIEKAVPLAKVTRMNPSVSVILDKKSLLENVNPLSWVHPVAEQDVDYEFEAGSNPPSTAEISKEFPALTPDQAAKVVRYCRVGLLEKYRSLETVDYFDKPRLWHLDVYDSMSDVTRYQYLVQRNQIELLLEEAVDSTNAVGWLTEIPIFKFHAALERGETMTSMYMRINDRLFDSETERDLQSVFIIDDPLARCLFNGEFGAYQKEQLRRLVK